MGQPSSSVHWFPCSLCLLRLHNIVVLVLNDLCIQGSNLTFLTTCPWGPVILKFYWPAEYSTVPLFPNCGLVAWCADCDCWCWQRLVVNSSDSHWCLPADSDITFTDVSPPIATFTDVRVQSLTDDESRATAKCIICFRGTQTVPSAARNERLTPPQRNHSGYFQVPARASGQ